MNDISISNSDELKKASQLGKIDDKKISADFFTNDQRMKNAQELFKETGLAKPFLVTTLNELMFDTKNFKNISEYQSVFQAYSQVIPDFKAMFTDFATDEVVKKGEFSPVQGFKSWDESLAEAKDSFKKMKAISTNLEPAMRKEATGVESAKNEESGEEMSAFDYLYSILDLYIQMNGTFLKLAMSYSLVLQNETEKQKVYIDIQGSLKPASVNAGYFEDTEDQETIDAVDLYNSTTLPQQQQMNNSNLEASQAASKEISNMVKAMTDSSQKVSDDFASLLSKLTSSASAIFR